MKKFTQVINSSKAPTEFAIHKAGCRDLAKDMGQQYAEEAESAEAIMKAEVQIYTDQDQGWNEEDFTIYPCCKNA